MGRFAAKVQGSGHVLGAPRALQPPSGSAGSAPAAPGTSPQTLARPSQRHVQEWCSRPVRLPTVSPPHSLSMSPIRNPRCTGE